MMNVAGGNIISPITSVAARMRQLYLPDTTAVPDSQLLSLMHTYFSIPTDTSISSYDGSTFLDPFLDLAIISLEKNTPATGAKYHLYTSSALGNAFAVLGYALAPATGLSGSTGFQQAVDALVVGIAKRAMNVSSFDVTNFADVRMSESAECSPPPHADVSFASSLDTLQWTFAVSWAASVVLNNGPYLTADYQNSASNPCLCSNDPACCSSGSSCLCNSLMLQAGIFAVINSNLELKARVFTSNTSSGPDILANMAKLQYVVQSRFATAAQALTANQIQLGAFL